MKVSEQRHCFAFTCVVKLQLIPEFALNFSSDLPPSLLVGDGPRGFPLTTQVTWALSSPRPVQNTNVYLFVILI